MKKTVGDWQYEIDTENVVRIWHLLNLDDSGAPLIYQPTRPLSSEKDESLPFGSDVEAEEWALNLIKEFNATIIGPKAPTE